MAAIIADPIVGSATPFGLGASSFGAAPYGASSFGGLDASSFGGLGASPFGASSFGASPFGASSFGASPFGASPFGASSFGTAGAAPGFAAGGPTVGQYAYQSAVQPLQNGGIVGPHPIASTFTGLAPTATGANVHNYAGFGYNRPTAYGYEGTRFTGGARGVPAAPILPLPSNRPYAIVGTRAPAPPVGNYGVAKGRFARSSKRVQGTGSNAGERYYAG